MLSLQELQFAAKFPFSKTAKNIIAQNNISLNKLPKELLERASLRIIKSFSNKPYEIRIFSDKEFLLQEILSFPIAKIFARLLGFSAIQNFTSSIYKTTYFYLQDISPKNALDLAQELNISISLSRNSFIIPLLQYCKASFLHKDLNLKFQNLKNGNIHLSSNSLLQFLAAFSQHIVYNEINKINPNSVPKEIKSYANNIKEKIYSKASTSINIKNIDIGAFPPCIKALYNAALSGENLSHFARYSLAAFLVAIGMPTQKIVEIFKSTPNFKEKTTKYQVERISKKGYKPYNCEKMKEMMLCISNCNAKSPLQFYKRSCKK